MRQPFDQNHCTKVHHVAVSQVNQLTTHAKDFSNAESHARKKPLHTGY